MVVVPASLCSLVKNEKVENTKHTNIETSWKNVPYKEGKMKDTDVPWGFLCPGSKAVGSSLVHEAN